MTAAELVLLAAYASLLVEIVCFPVASEASVAHLVGRTGAPTSPALAAARSSALPVRLACYLLPTALCVLLFLLPLAVTLAPSTRPFLAPWSTPALVWPGVAAVVAGRALTFVSVLQLRRARRRAALPAGLFQRSRNPGLVGMFVMYAGLCAAVGGPWLWLGAPVYVRNMHARVLLEESDLAARFGAAWRDYTVTAPRYLPVPGMR